MVNIYSCAVAGEYTTFAMLAYSGLAIITTFAISRLPGQCMWRNNQVFHVLPDPVHLLGMCGLFPSEQDRGCLGLAHVILTSCPSAITMLSTAVISSYVWMILDWDTCDWASFMEVDRDEVDRLTKYFMVPFGGVVAK